MSRVIKVRHHTTNVIALANDVYSKNGNVLLTYPDGKNQMINKNSIDSKWIIVSYHDDISRPLELFTDKESQLWEDFKQENQS